MILTNVFDDLTDPVIILTQEGEMSYANTAAKSLIHGETVDTLGIGPLQRVFSQLEQREIPMPLIFEFSTKQWERYQAKINHLYSAYVVHCRRVNSPVASKYLRQKTVNMLHDYLSDPLEKFEIAMESLLAELGGRQIVEQADKAKFNSLIQQSSRLSSRISQVEKLGELYFADSLPDYELIAVSQLLNKLTQHPETREELEDRLIIQSDSEDSLYCEISWMLSAIAACVRQLLTDSSDEHMIVITHTTNKYFHQISMKVNDRSDLAVADMETSHRYITYRDHEITEMMDLDLLIAARVIDMHGGQLKFNPGDNGGLVLEIPFDGQKTNQDMRLQAKLYAEDLAELTSHSNAQAGVSHFKH